MPSETHPKTSMKAKTGSFPFKLLSNDNDMSLLDYTATEDFELLINEEIPDR